MATTCHSTTSIANVAAYKFVRLDGLAERQRQLHRLCGQLELKGTILLSQEGINLFVAGRQPQVDQLLKTLRDDPALADLEAKYSCSDRQPFNRMLVKIKREIIAFGVESIRPANYTSRKISPEALKRQIDEGQAPVLLDVRNTYETDLGTFDNAITLPLESFRDFPTAAATLPAALRQRPLVMFCTGGIRCEKAGPYLEELGFEDVHQLEGGILKYFEQCEGAHYQGECFVFDQRVAVDTALQETATEQCFRCQHPLTCDDQAAATYQPGVSCPYCFRPPEQTAAKQLTWRKEQIQRITQPLPGSTAYTNRRPIFVSSKDDNRQLIDFVSGRYSFTPREAWLERIEGGFLLRDGHAMTAADRVQSGDRLEHVFPHTTEPDVNADIVPIYEDEWLVGVSKPAPLPMHPCGRFNRNSLIWILNQVYGPQKLRPAHRLDANTTGVVVLSRTRNAASQLQPRFERGEIRKTYLARVWGHPPDDEFVCNAPISAHSLAAGARTVDPAGLTARTEFHVRQRSEDGTALLRVHPITGARTKSACIYGTWVGRSWAIRPIWRVAESPGDRRCRRTTIRSACMRGKSSLLTRSISSW